MAWFVLLLSMSLAVHPSVAQEKSEKSDRPPPPPLESLQLPKAAGPLRVLLVDDDWSANNGKHPLPQLSASDVLFRQFVQSLTKADGAESDVEIVRQYEAGPSLERLKGFNLIIWYTGGSYGGNADNSAVVSREDEKTLRAYLEQVGGAVVLLSPGYLTNHQYGSTWERSAYPFIREVLGVDGFAGLVQRFAGGAIVAPDGAQFNIEDKGGVETQFSAANPRGAALVFTSQMKNKRPKDELVPVAVANAFGAGRLVYAGFTLENVSESERAPVFQRLVAATGLAGRLHELPRSPAVLARGDLPRPALPTATPALTGGALPAIPPLVSTTPVTATAPAPTPSQTPAEQRIIAAERGLVAGNSQVSKQSIRAPEPAPAGEPPVFRYVRSTAADTHEVFWEPYNMDQGVRESDGWDENVYDLFRKVGDRFILLVEGTKNTSFVDHAFIDPGSVYKLVKRYPDGRVGEVEYVHNDVPRPKVVEWARAEQLGTRRVQITWKRGEPRQVGERSPRVFASGLPPEGVEPEPGDSDAQGLQWVTISNVPEGVHRFRVSYVYTLPAPADYRSM